MRPRPDDLHRFDVIKNLVHKAVLDADPPGACAGKVPNQFLVRGRALIWVGGQNIEKPLCLGFEPRTRELLRVPLGLLRVNQPPFHQSSASSHFSTGVFRPFTIASLIPGMPTR